MLKGSYLMQPHLNGVDNMTIVSPVAYFSLWMLLVLAWKPAYYVAMYFVGVATKNAATSATYGGLLHAWICSLWGLVL